MYHNVARNTVSVPGKILESTIIFGLTFDELIVLAAIPLVLVLPAAFIDQIPLSITIGIVVIGFLGVGVVILKTPKGQSPVGWFPSYIERYIKPAKLYLKPRDDTQYIRSNVKYLNVIYTADRVKQETEQTITKADVDQLIDEIDNAEKLEYPEVLKKQETET